MGSTPSMLRKVYDDWLAAPNLVGRSVACWCRLCDRHREGGLPLGEECPDCAPCHGDVILRIANGSDA